MDTMTILAAAAALVLGVLGGRALEVRRARAAKRSAEDEAAAVLDGARAEADSLRRAAELAGREEGYRLKQELLEEAEQRRGELDKTEKRLVDREEGLDRKLDLLDQRQERVAKREEEVSQRRDELKSTEEALQSERSELRARLEKVAGLTVKEARAQLISRIEDEARAEAARTVRDIRERARREAEREARKIIAMSVQRLAVDHSSEITVSVVPLPSGWLLAKEIEQRLGPTATKRITALGEGESVTLTGSGGDYVVTLIEQHTRGSLSFEEARDAVRAAFLRAQGEAAVRDFLEVARKRSDIRVEVEP